MGSSTENVKLGVCSVIFDGVNLGFTKGGVEVEVSTMTHEVKVDQFGETPIGELITGRSVSAKVPLAETTLENLVAIMPGSTLISDGVKATGTVTYTTVPVNLNTVVVAGTTFTFKTTPTGPNDLAIPANITAAAAAIANAINSNVIPYSATSAAGVVTVKAKQSGTDGNAAITVTGTGVTAVSLTGGTNPTKAKVSVKTGVSTNLLSVAKKLTLRPTGTVGEDDFTIHRAACPGALSFSYTVDQERVYQADFKGYALENGDLFDVGDTTATA